MSNHNRLSSSGYQPLEDLPLNMKGKNMHRQMSFIEPVEKLLPLSRYKSAKQLPAKSYNSSMEFTNQYRHSEQPLMQDQFKLICTDSPRLTLDIFHGIKQKLKIAHTSILGRRPTQEDAFITFTHNCYTVIALFDGHNGSQVSQFCANQLKEVLVHHIEIQEKNSKTGVIDFELVLQDTIDQLNNVICNSEQLRTQGTTALIFLLDHDIQEIHIANVGDSRCQIGFQEPLKLSEIVSLNQQVYKQDENDTATNYFRTIDHKPEEKNEIERLKKCDATVQEIDGVTRVDGCLSVSRSIGDYEFKKHVICKQDYYKINYIQQVKYIFLCCDGFIETFDSDETDQLMQQCISKKYCNIQLRENLQNRQFTKNVSINYEESKMVTTTLFENVNSQRSFGKQVTQVLTKMAYLNGSQDNVSVALCVIE